MKVIINNNNDNNNNMYKNVPYINQSLGFLFDSFVNHIPVYLSFVKGKSVY
jgi:hypothetical protein